MDKAATVLMYNMLTDKMLAEINDDLVWAL